MTQLFWKEWRELRMLPVGACLCVALVIFGMAAFRKSVGDHSSITTEDTAGWLFAIWLLCGALAGAGTLASEVGAGTLQFLTSLPPSRGQVWWVKASTALGMMLLSIACSLVAWLLLHLVFFRHGFSPAPWLKPEMFLPDMLLYPAMGAFGALGCLAVAITVSPLFDRSLSASVAAILTCAALLVTVPNLVSAHINYQHHNSDTCMLVVLALSIPLFAAISYQTWTRGESLRTPRRFIVAAQTGAIGLILGFVIFCIGYTLQLW